MQVDSAGISLDSLPDICQSVDVQFDGRRVWSIAVDSPPAPLSSQFETWPVALRERLVGYTEVTIADSGTGQVFFHQNVKFSEENVQTIIADANGTPLSVNKWGDLAPDLAGLPAGVVSQLLASSSELIEVLRRLGKRPFVVGGTLLGAVREGRLLPHDDDVDIAYLSEYTNPTDVAVEGLALGHKLRELGYEFMRHSAAHLQLIFRGDNGTPEYHVDIFSAFFTDDGFINQPFHVRGQMSPSQLVPFSTVQIEEYDLPAPANPEAWLVVNYDENWRTPLPGYRLLTPSSTIRRFENWFGGFNFRREFWDRWFQETPVGSNLWNTGAKWITQQVLESPTILELGCGDGTLSSELGASHPHSKVIASDYSPVALHKARRATILSNVSFVHANLNRLEALETIHKASTLGAFDLVANSLLDQVTPAARTITLRLIRKALQSGGKAYATSYATPARNLTPDDPTTWHLDRDVLRREAQNLGLETSFTQLSGEGSESRRSPYGVIFSLAKPLGDARRLSIERTSMKNRIKSLIRRSTQSELQIQVEDLRDQVRELQGDLDEYRRLSLRTAEILDLVEERLISQGPASPTE